MGIASLVLAGRRAGGERAPATASPGAEDAPPRAPGEVPDVAGERPDAVRESTSPHSAAAPSASTGGGFR
jgi:hypothetical protein